VNHAPTGYEPCQGDEAVGWLTHVGCVRYSWTFVRPGRNGWRVTTWTKRIPERFRDERLKRSNLVIHIPD
jgi:hypothetical protein